jgi:hypothetical protein
MDTAARRSFYATDNHYYQVGVDDPSSVATDGLPGSIYIQVPVYPATVPAPMYWKKNDNGETTNWTQLITGGGGGTPERDSFILTALDISNGYVDLSFVTDFNSVIPTLDGAGPMVYGAGYDYTLSNVVTTRLTFDPTLIPYLAVGDLLEVQYVH